jgi:hypothetical protein
VRLTGDGERLVLVMHVFEGRPQVWVSTDGSTWAPVEVGPVASYASAVPTSFGWMIPGHEPLHGCVVWVSADGEHWERVPLFPSPVPDGLGSQCHGDFPHDARGEWFGKDTVLASVTDDLWGQHLALWRGGFED